MASSLPASLGISCIAPPTVKPHTLLQAINRLHVQAVSCTSPMTPGRSDAERLLLIGSSPPSSGDIHRHQERHHESVPFRISLLRSRKQDKLGLQPRTLSSGRLASPAEIGLPSAIMRLKRVSHGPRLSELAQTHFKRASLF